jgi:hypothetical protein
LRILRTPDLEIRRSLRELKEFKPQDLKDLKDSSPYLAASVPSDRVAS